MFSYADYAVDYTRRSTVGVVIVLHGGPIAGLQPRAKQLLCQLVKPR